MAKSTFRWNGLDELKADLRNLPRELSGEGRAIVLAHGDQAFADILAGYAERSGNLKRGLKKRVEESPVGVTVIIRNLAPHAGLWEHGTKARHTKLGWSRGTMKGQPAANTFISKMQRSRRRMQAALAALLERKGLTVRGSFNAAA